MARMKEQPKPLCDVKQPLYDSLDRVVHEGIMLDQALRMALEHGHITGSAKEIIQERRKAFRVALVGED